MAITYYEIERFITIKKSFIFGLSPKFGDGVVKTYAMYID